MRPRADGSIPEVTVEGRASRFTLRPGVTLPPQQSQQLFGQSFTTRWVRSGGKRPVIAGPRFAAPVPGQSPDVELGRYPNLFLVGGTSVPVAAFLVQEILCGGGFDPELAYTIQMPPRSAPTGEWVFDVDLKTCGQSA